MEELTVIERQDMRLRVAVAAHAHTLKMQLPDKWDADVSQLVLRLFRQQRALAERDGKKVLAVLLTARYFRALAATCGATVKEVKPDTHMFVMGIMVKGNLKDDAREPFWFEVVKSRSRPAYTPN